MSPRILSCSLSLALVATSACMHAPDRAKGYGTPPPILKQEVDDVPVNGFKVWVKLDDGERLVGELLVADSEGEVMVRTKKGDRSRPFADIRRATVLTDPNVFGWFGGIGGMTGGLIPLSFLTGYYVIVAAPIVAGAGIVAAGIAWAESRVVLTGDELDYLHQYARWPQGQPVVIEVPVEPAVVVEPVVVEPVVVEPPSAIEPMPFAR
ncbi:hypothetical protein ACNOYE_35220 [Nannocystaceae bacterium ST9]